MQALPTILKYTGTKRTLAPEIISHFPKHVDTFYEPFCGSASVSLLMMASNHNVGRYVLSDTNTDVIGFFNLLKTDPDFLKGFYTKWWNYINEGDLSLAKERFYWIRGKFNAMPITDVKRAALFCLLTRLCINGLVRYNSRGEFTSGFHLTRRGIEPQRLNQQLDFFHGLLSQVDVTFAVADFRTLRRYTKKDLVFCDPPYFFTKGMYKKDALSSENFFKSLPRVPRYAFTYDGEVDGEELFSVSSAHYKHKYQLRSADSSFSKLKQKKRSVIEYLYTSY